MKVKDDGLDYSFETMSKEEKDIGSKKIIKEAKDYLVSKGFPKNIQLDDSSVMALYFEGCAKDFIEEHKEKIYEDIETQDDIEAQLEENAVELDRALERRLELLSKRDELNES